ncbi:MAG: hypothetical protein HC913_02645 [Microscillaceae bacterium]|nr:hypothetical protein [Microscillaceae bacterium]
MNFADSQKIIVVKQAGDTLFLNQLALLTRVGKNCLRGKDAQGTYLVCLEARKYPFDLSPRARF